MPESETETMTAADREALAEEGLEIIVGAIEQHLAEVADPLEARMLALYRRGVDVSMDGAGPWDVMTPAQQEVLLSGVEAALAAALAA